jgi:peptide/nickel transport system permease protein
MAVNRSGEVAEVMAAEPKKRNFWLDMLVRMLKEKPLGTIGLVIVAILLICGIFANWLAPYPLGKIDLLHTLSGPVPGHILGTDNLGRDELSNIIYGARISLIIGLSATALLTVVSVIIGSLSALIGGKFDIVIQRIVDAFMCIPGLLILLIMMSILGRGMWQMIIAISIPGGIGGSRMIRGAVLGIKENVYVDAERAIGCNMSTLLIRHILPNIMPVIIIGFSVMIGGTILMEAGLSFLGFGVPPGVPSWGSMLSQEGRQYMEIAPALSIWPGLALSVVVWGLNMFGDAIRDLLDPRLKGGLGRYGGSRQKKKAMKAVLARQR